MKLVVFGAGNIGRSFVGQLFSHAGYGVTFVEVDQALVAALNRAGRYCIEVRDRNPETRWVEGVRAVDGRNLEVVARELAEADIAATAVGPNALRFIYPAIAAGLGLRQRTGAPPLDIIICENLRNAAEIFRQGITPLLPPDFPLEDIVGLIETSIGKMVPIMPEEARREDPLLLYAEAYNTLILDAKAFKNPIPKVPGLDPKQHMAAYVDRKAFIHNCGHAAAAYLGYLRHPEAVYLWEVIEDMAVQKAVRRAMGESARALMYRYPGEFTSESQQVHIEDLLSRFANRALGDTVYRVGRDLPRKLSREDRMIGALLMEAAYDVPAPFTTLVTAAGMLFLAADEQGEPFPADAQFGEELKAKGMAWALTEVCGLRLDDSREAAIAASLEKSFVSLQGRAADWLERALRANRS